MATITDEAACARAVVAFYVALDTGDAEECAALVAEDVAWHRAEGVVRGRDAARVVVAGRDPRRVTFHQVANLLVTVEGDAARADYALVVQVGVAEGPGPAALRSTAVLRGGDRLVRTAEGWRIAEKRFTTVLKGP